MLIVEPDRQSCFGLCGNDIGCLVADNQVGDLDIARLKPIGACVERDGFDLGQNRNKPWNWVVRQMWIRDMALRARDGNPHVHRTATADFHHVAQAVDAGRFADEAIIRDAIACLHMGDQCPCAVDGRPFFVARDDQADRACILGDVMQRSNKGGDAALHIDSAASMQQIALNLWHKRVASPAIAGRHDIDVTSKRKVLSACRTNGEQIFNRRAMCGVGIVFARNKAFDGKAQRNKHIFKRVKNRASGRCDAFASDQSLGISQCKSIIH